MCGIFGWAGRSLRRRHDPDLLRVCTRALAHRGPDGEGFFEEDGIALGHRRLSILDLANGAQPFFSPSKRYVVTYNGEIYNAPELRIRLQKKAMFSPRTATRRPLSFWPMTKDSISSTTWKAFLPSGCGTAKKSNFFWLATAWASNPFSTAWTPTACDSPPR